MANYPTPHIHAKPGDFGKTVLMPGDPLRSKFIAENFLENAVLVNNVRGIQGYTGTYQRQRRSPSWRPAWACRPSASIPGSCSPSSAWRTSCASAPPARCRSMIKLRDIVIGQGACTDSNWAAQYHLPGTFAPDRGLSTCCETCVETAKELGLPYHVGNILSSDRFYGDDGDMPERLDQATTAWQKMGVLAVEMEAAALYMNAARAGKHALAICTGLRPSAAQ